MQGIPDWAWIEQLLQVAEAHQLFTMVKALVLVCVIGTAVFVARELVVKPALHLKRKRNGGTEYDQLARQSALLGLLAERQEHTTEKLGVLADQTEKMRREQRKLAMRQASALDRIADEAAKNNQTQATVLGILQGVINRRPE